jgi:hypothetical protein
VLRVTEHFRKNVLSGQCPSGHRLPSTRVAAKELGVHHVTVASAYRRLAAEGTVTLRPGIGAFAKETERKAQYFFCTGSPRGRHGTHSLNVAESIMAHFAGRPIPANMHFVSLSADGWSNFLNWLRSGIETRAIAGIWTDGMHQAQVAEVCSILATYDAPVIDLRATETHTAPYSLRYGIQTMIRQGARYLQKQGCRHIVFLSERLHQAPEREEAFRATCEALDVEGEIVELIPDLLGSTLGQIERSGSIGAAEVMGRERRPDGLFIVDDFVGRGVLATLLRLRVRVPQDLRVCTLARAGDSYPDVYGLPVARMEVDHVEFAEVACTLMERIAAKEAIETPHVIVPWHLIEPASEISEAGDGSRLETQAGSSGKEVAMKE